MRIHFICRGNSFRSVIAEAYAKSLNLKDIEFTSSGTIAERIGSPNAERYMAVAAELKKRGLGKFVKIKWGDKTTQDLLDNADLCVFMNKIVENEAIKLGLEYKKSTCLKIDDFDEGENLKNKNRNFTEVLNKTTPHILNQIDELLYKIGTEKN